MTTPAAPSTLILVPTPLESRALFGRELGDGVRIEELPDSPIFAHTGFGLAAAGVMATRALQMAPETKRVFLLGIAGSYELGRADLGVLVAAESVVVDGIGAGEGSSFESADAMGFRQLENLTPGPMALARTDTIENQGLLVSVAAAAANANEADQRRLRQPSALFEDMESWSVALACHQAQVPLTVVRAISNAVGDRDSSGWKVEESLDALRRHLPVLLSP